MRFLIISIAFIIIKSTSSELLNCDFIYFDEDGYNCKMIDSFNEQKEITEVAGSHRAGKNLTNVETFYISSQSDTNYMPTNLCTHFPNLKKIDIYAKKLVEVTKDIFDGCSKLEVIYLRNLNFNNFSEDIFCRTPTLTKVMVIDSKIEVLQKDIFKNNEKIFYIKFDNNGLKLADFELSENQKSNINHFSFLNNPCISKAYKSDDYRSPSLNDVILELSTKCRISSVTTLAPPVESPNEQRIQILETKVEDLEEVRKSLVVKIQDGVRDAKEALTNTGMKVEVLQTRLDTFSKYIETNLTAEIRDVKTNFDKLNSEAVKISSQSVEMSKKVEENLKLKSSNLEIQSNIDHNESLLIATFVLQMITIAFCVVITIYVKFFSISGPKTNSVENLMYNGRS